MAINATNSGKQRELIPAGNYIARCYQMIEIGTVEEVIMGQTKTLSKVRIGWELPEETRVFKEENGEQPFVISQEFTLSLNEKANLRKMLASWRGKDFTEEEAKSFDVSKLIGVPCMLNVIHKPSKTDPTKIYEQIGSVSPLPKSVKCPDQVNKTVKLEYDSFNWDLFNTMPDFIKTKMRSSLEFASLQQPDHTNIPLPNEITEPIDDLPF
ncbi:MAG TPA: hypothetical protein VF487_20190 [Chitinophagaceae bacterium]